MFKQNIQIFQYVFLKNNLHLNCMIKIFVKNVILYNI